MGRTTTDTKQKLIDTALELIWKSSYGSVSVDDICKAADVKKGSFYHFFPSKVDLAIAAIEESYKSLKPLYENFSPESALVKRFERLAEFVYESQSQAAFNTAWFAVVRALPWVRKWPGRKLVFAQNLKISLAVLSAVTRVR